MGRGFPSPRKKDSADRAAIHAVTRWGKRPARGPTGAFGANRQGNSAGSFPHGVGGELSPRAARRGAPRGRGVGRGFPSPRKRTAGIAKRSTLSPGGGSAPHADQLAPSARIVRGIVRGASPTGLAGSFPHGLRGAERRGGGVWGGVSPPREKGQRGSQSDPRCHPVGEAPRTRTNWRLWRDSRQGIVRGAFPTGCQYADSKQPRPDPAVHWSRSATRPSGPRQFWVWVHQK